MVVGGFESLTIRIRRRRKKKTADYVPTRDLLFWKWDRKQFFFASMVVVFVLLFHSVVLHSQKKSHGAGWFQVRIVQFHLEGYDGIDSKQMAEWRDCFCCRNLVLFIFAFFKPHSRQLKMFSLNINGYLAQFVIWQH